ncbi:ABC transporter substrate-binding protein [Metabacillus arenae]|uniref:ABC transporter substrate-binding protein n=1 Tax=Metabacillus arenae TaxID=2771434 RepID=A0A926RW77_9BACI|nr:ABC transporter substrate-binding protein [Metabacillus arenae]MBD1380493.1 ABC transporter substrate-binding protein [Metabacillus arenae]
MSFKSLIFIICISLLAACQSTSEQAGTAQEKAKDEEVTLRFYSYNLGNAAHGTGTQMLIDEFMKEHPNINIEGVPVPIAEVNSRIHADVVAGNSPDIAQMGFNAADSIVNEMKAIPLESIASEKELEEHFEGFSPNAVNLGKLNGQTYGLPFTISTPVLFYNASLFKQAGLDPNQPPKNWGEVKEYALAIKDATDASGIQIASDSYDWIIQALIASNGGQVVSDNRKEVTFGSDEAIESIKMWQDLVQSGAHSKMTYEEAKEAMFQGKIGMFLLSSAVQSTLIDSAESGGWELRSAEMPGFGEQQSRPTNSGSGLFVLSDDPVKQKAAWEFMKFVTSERGYTIITSEIGYLPLRPEIVKDPEYLQEWAEKNPLIQPNLNQLERLTPWTSYPGENYSNIEKILVEAVRKATFTDGDVKKIMQDAQLRAQDLVK